MRWFVTGASSGIGEAVADAAEAAGHEVIRGSRSTGCDVTDFAALEAFLQPYPDLDVVVANAGVGSVERTFKAETPEFMRQVVETNVLGTAFTIRATMDRLIASRGHLVVMSSCLGRVIWPGSLYCATKFAVTAMAESAQAELEGTGVRVTSVEPGTVDTPFFRTDHPVEGRMVPEDVANAVMYAVSQPPHVDVGQLLVRATIQGT